MQMIIGWIISIISIIVGALISIYTFRERDKKDAERTRKSVRPYFSAELDVPPEDGIGFTAVKYCFINRGNGTAFETVIVPKHRIVEGMKYSAQNIKVIGENSIITVSNMISCEIEWTYEPNMDLDNIVYEKNRPIRDEIEVHFSDTYDEKYTQLVILDFNDFYYPKNISVKAERPLLVEQ